MSLCLAGRSSSLASIQRFLSCFARGGPGDSCSDLGSLDQFRSVNVIDPNMSHMCGSCSTVRFKSHQSRAMDANFELYFSWLMRAPYLGCTVILKNDETMDEK